MELLKFMHENYDGLVADRYGITESDDQISSLNQIAENRKFLLKGNELDINKAAVTLLDEFRNGKIGRISLERRD